MSMTISGMEKNLCSIVPRFLAVNFFSLLLPVGSRSAATLQGLEVRLGHPRVRGVLAERVPERHPEEGRDVEARRGRASEQGKLHEGAPRVLGSNGAL